MSRKLDPRVARSRAVVLGAAVELLVERGINGTTVEAIAAHSGVAKTTIYRHWDGLPALVLDAFDSVLMRPADPDTGSLREDLLRLLGGLAEALRAGPVAALLATLLDAAEHDAAFAALHRAHAAARNRIVRAVIDRGISRGELPEGTDAAEVVDMLAGPLFHRRLVNHRAVDAAYARRIVERSLRAFGHRPSHGRDDA